jgi:hypothetical protein
MEVREYEVRDDDGVTHQVIEQTYEVDIKDMYPWAADQGYKIAIATDVLEKATGEKIDELSRISFSMERPKHFGSN